MVTPYLPSRTTSARAALPDHALPRLRCHSVSSASGSGSHTRDTPSAKSTSARVVTSKVRHPDCAKAIRHGRAAAAALITKALRSMVAPWRAEISGTTGRGYGGGGGGGGGATRSTAGHAPPPRPPLDPLGRDASSRLANARCGGAARPQCTLPLLV